MIKQFQWNDELCEWQRVERVQMYKGVKIETVTTHADYHNAPRHREYRLTWADGHDGWFPINKRGGNIKDLKHYIDVKLGA